VSASLRPLFLGRALDPDEQIPRSADDVTDGPSQRWQTMRLRLVGSRLPIQGRPRPNPSAQRFGSSLESTTTSLAFMKMTCAENPHNHDADPATAACPRRNR
jgi:hypothetical protein